MTKSNTRKWWSLFLSEVAWAGEKGHAEAVEKVMGLPEVGLAELAESNPNYRLAVVDDCNKPDDFSVVKGANGALHASGIALGQEAMWDNGYRRVVKMEER